jgi:hypothetical protein
VGAAKGPKLAAFRIVSVAIGCLMALAAVEIGFRFKVANDLAHRHDAPTYTVFNTSLYKYDDAHGYAYVPGKKCVGLLVRDGQAVRTLEGHVNADGNIGREPAEAEDSEYRILVLGDSFTSNPIGPDGPITWTDYLRDVPWVDEGRPVRILNAGRDGYSVLQMVELGADLIESYEPHLVILAIIADDLTRDRFWRSTVDVAGRERVFTSDRRGNPPDIRYCTDAWMIDPAVADWPKLDDAAKLRLVAKLNDQYRVLTASHLSVNLWMPRHSFLWNEIVHGDAFHGIHTPSYNPRHAYASLAEDAAFAAKCAEVVESKATLALVLMPTPGELAAQSYVLDGRQRALLTSLEQLLHTRTLGLFSFCPAQPVLEDLFQLPYDFHPNHAGAAMYARAIAAVVARHPLVRRRQPAAEAASMPR